jgi:hypothetical protein
MVWSKNLCYIVVIISTIMLLGGVEGWKMFHRGRGHGGMLGSPRAAPNTTVPPAEWFLQRLDHFNPTVLHTWKQVKNIYLELAVCRGHSVSAVLFCRSSGLS